MTGHTAYTIGERLLTVDNVCVHYDRPILEGVSGHIDNIRRADRPGRLPAGAIGHRQVAAVSLHRRPAAAELGQRAPQRPAT
jgi:hypothetical protein